MDQGTARKRAKELGGVAVGARKSPSDGRWILDTWSGQPGETFIVVSLDRTEVLDDRDPAEGDRA